MIRRMLRQFFCRSSTATKSVGLRLTTFLLLSSICIAACAADKPNVLIITTDDMSCDSVGVYGCKLKDTTPTMDALAAQCMRFEHAHVQVGNCMPSRNVMFSGRYPHNNRVEGFYPITDPDYPVMSDLMKAAGYFTGIRNKVSHSTPYHPYPAWDVVLDDLLTGKNANHKNVESYYLSARKGIEAAKEAGKPFCLNLNISDPHKPFYNEGGKGDPNVPSRVFKADEVPVPGFLPDDPQVREELALYYSSVRRADDCLAEILKALKESGEDDRTIIFFLSDHGMPLPFAKTQLYFHSTRTPWMVKWPGVTKPGTVDSRHMISGVDLLPTLLDVLGLSHPTGMDGRSFAPLLRGETQTGRDMVVTEYNENSGGNRHPMRSIVTRDFAYIFSPWSNGTRKMATATSGTITYRRMNVLAAKDPAIAARLDLFDHRVPEELYNYATDRDALMNLAKLPKYRAEYDRLTKSLEAWMEQTKDPMLEVFRKRNDPQAREDYMAKVEQEAKDRNKPKKEKKAARQQNKKAQSVKAETKATSEKDKNLISVDFPQSVSIGDNIVLKIEYKLPIELKEQLVHVTLKDDDGNRIERQVITVSGTGRTDVTFTIPKEGIEKQVSFAAFIGKEFTKKLLQLNSKQIPATK